MALYLVQHGKSLSKETDPERGLSEDGIKETGLIADTAKNYRIKVRGIRHSGKKRAFQTAEIFAFALKPVDGVRESAGLNPLDDVSSFAETIRTEDEIMLVGHLPFMANLVSFLITGSTDKPVFQFQNSGIVCMDKVSDTGQWIIKWTLMPQIS
jgi:phosphohistidine phosphatase